VATNDLLQYIPPLSGILGAGGFGAVLVTFIVSARLRRRDSAEVKMFADAFDETKDPSVLGYYAQMRCKQQMTWTAQERRSLGCSVAIATTAASPPLLALWLSSIWSGPKSASRSSWSTATPWSSG
jgi:hypothetical protein